MTDILTTQQIDTAVVPAAERRPASRVRSGLARALGIVLATVGDRRGITTVEYVIGIIAGITLVGVLIVALTNPHVQAAIVALVEHIFGQGSAVKPGTPSGGHT